MCHTSLNSKKSTSFFKLYHLLVNFSILFMYRKSLANQGLYKKKLDTNQDTHSIKIGVQLWCERRDLNPYESPHTPLKRARLPIPPLSQVCSESLSLFPQNVDYYSKRGCLCQAFFQSFFNIFSFIFKRRLAWDYSLSKAIILSAIALNTGAQSDAPPLPPSLKTVMT